MATTTRTQREIFRCHSGHVYLLRFADNEREAAHECCYRWAETRGVPLTMGQAIEMASEIGPFQRDERPLPGVYYHYVERRESGVSAWVWVVLAVVVLVVGRAWL